MFGRKQHRQRPHSMWPLFLSWKAIFIFVTIPVLSFCGKGDEESVPSEQMMAVNGSVPVGSQCPYGYYTDPKPLKVNGWECGEVLQSIDIIESPSALILQADCKKKLLTVRTVDSLLDSTWEIMPDGTFSLTVDSGALKIRDDGAGNPNCVTFPSTEVWGKIDCGDADKLTINYDIIWWPGRGKNPSAYRPAALTGPECKLPSTCYFHSTGQLKQCE